MSYIHVKKKYKNNGEKEDLLLDWYVYMMTGDERANCILTSVKVLNTFLRWLIPASTGY